MQLVIIVILAIIVLAILGQVWAFLNPDVGDY